MHWIEPIKEQLNRLEKRFEQLSAPTPATALPMLPRSAQAQSKPSKLKPSPPSFSAASSPVGTHSSNYVLTCDDILEDESPDSCSTCACVHV